MQKEVQIGILTLTIDPAKRCDQMFLDAFDAGLECYCECDGHYQRQVTVDQLVRLMRGVVTDDDDKGGKPPLWWVYGFILGWITGLNNPDIINDDPKLSYTESVIRKHIPLYRDLVLQDQEAREEERVTDTELEEA